MGLYRWSLNPVLAEDAVTTLNRHQRAASGWADALEAAIHADPRTRDSVTLYLLASAVTSGSCAPLLAAFVEDITETARGLAARSPGAHLDPPLLLALDEIANLTPLPSLPQLTAEGGGSGITTLAVLLSLAQARNRWGEHAADAIWDAATVKLVLGGLAKYRDLDDVATPDPSSSTSAPGPRGAMRPRCGLIRTMSRPPRVLLNEGERSNGPHHASRSCAWPDPA